MNLPSFPFDNLYKFMAIFGLVLFIFSIYMLNDIDEKIFSKIDSLQARDTVLIQTSKLDSVLLSKSTSQQQLLIIKERADVNKEIKGLVREAEKFPKRFIGFIGLLLSGVGLSVWGFILWYNRTQKFTDMILKKDALDNEKSISIHKLQFEKEFQVYNELWPCLINLKNATLNLRPWDDDKSENSEDARRIIQGEEFIKSWKLFVEVYDKNKPFYPEGIYNTIDLLLIYAYNEKALFDNMHKSLIEDSDELTENYIRQLNEEIDDVCLKIRERIGLIVVKD